MEYPINERRLPADISHLEIEMRDVPTETWGVYSFGILPGYENNLLETHPQGYFGDMILETPQDRLTAVVRNESEEDLTFILKLFYNYQEVAFKIVGDEDYRTEFIFTIDSGWEFNIPFHLHSSIERNDFLNKLTAGIFLNPEGHAHWEQHLESSFALMLNYEISFGGQERITLTGKPAVPIKEIDSLRYTGVMVNQDFNPFAVGARRPPTLLQAASGEVIEFAFVASAYGIIIEQVENYLFIVMVDWHQTLLDDAPYLWLESDGEDRGQHGSFTITAPLEPGLYEVVAFFIPNPTRPASMENYFPLQISTRFTLEIR